ncbi:MAG: hypothetical protein L0Y72_09965 [Gemmataceae bacterium]|nr:hypothetical protein [Gemmataceae bacterium]MCI0739358.1 hypothetical protein [Gemmataceae bacterium]
MDLVKKIKTVLNRSFKPQVLELEDDDGVIGVVVSDHFRAVESLDRQLMIQNALRQSLTPLSMEEMSRILAIAPMTPEEYVAYGPKNKVRRKAR